MADPRWMMPDAHLIDPELFHAQHEDGELIALTEKLGGNKGITHGDCLLAAVAIRTMLVELHDLRQGDFRG